MRPLSAPIRSSAVTAVAALPCSIMHTRIFYGARNNIARGNCGSDASERGVYSRAAKRERRTPNGGLREPDGRMSRKPPLPFLPFAGRRSQLRDASAHDPVSGDSDGNIAAVRLLGFPIFYSIFSQPRDPRRGPRFCPIRQSKRQRNRTGPPSCKLRPFPQPAEMRPKLSSHLGRPRRRRVLKGGRRRDGA